MRINNLQKFPLDMLKMVNGPITYVAMCFIQTIILNHYFGKLWLGLLHFQAPGF